MFSHYLSTALRTLWRFRTTTTISIVGLALALGCFVAALGAVIYLSSGESQTANADRILLVTEEMHPRNVQNLDFASVRSSAPLARQLRIDFPQIEAVGTARDLLDIPVAAEGRLGYLRAATANADFVRMFGLSFIESSSTNPLSIPNGVVITDETALKLFGTVHAVGKTITLNKALDVTVTGVMNPMPQPSHIGSSPDHLLRFDILSTEETYWRFRRAQNPELPEALPFGGDAWGSPVFFTYVLLPADGSLTAAMLNDELDAFTKRHTDLSRNYRLNFKHRAVPIKSVRLAQLNADLFKGNGLSFGVLILSLSGIVLAVACFNYANLATAQTLVRFREFGLHRVLGASALQIATRQWIEGGVQMIVAMLLAVGIVAGATTWLGEDATTVVVTALNQPSLWMALALTCVGLVFLLGAYSTFHILRRYPAAAMRMSNPLQRKSLGVGVLVGIQFAVAGALLVGLLVVSTQNEVVRQQALRPQSDPVVVLEFPGRDSNIETGALESVLEGHRSIREVSGIIRMPWSTKQSSITGISTVIGGTLSNALVDFVRYDFERTLDVTLLAGRSFDRQLGDKSWPAAYSTVADTYPVVIDRSTASRLGWANPRHAVNRSFYWPLFANGKLSGAHAELKIIGVIEDNPLRFDAGPGAHLQIYALVPSAPGQILVRIDKQRIQEALAHIDATWRQVAPYAPIRRHFLDELFEREYRTLDRAGKAVTALTVVGTSVALMGLFGIATFVAQRRRREIGVRKTLGASTRRVVAMLIRDLSMPVLIANVLIWPFAYAAAQKYLAMFVHRIDLGVWPFALSLVIAVLLAWLAVGGHAWRAARLKPADVLRHE
jgi:putative ABC transport system permease protein